MLQQRWVPLRPFQDQSPIPAHIFLEAEVAYVIRAESVQVHVGQVWVAAVLVDEREGRAPVPSRRADCLCHSAGEYRLSGPKRSGKQYDISAAETAADLAADLQGGLR